MKTTRHKKFKSYPYLQVIIYSLFALVALILMIGFNSPYLRRIEELSLFLPTASFWKECMELPGGLLTWSATFLTQFFYYPWLGSIIYTLLLITLCFLTSFTFKLRGQLVAFSIIPSVLILFGLLNLGYVIFSLKSPGFAYTPLLGWTIAVGVFLTTDIAKGWLQCIVMALWILTYPLFGAYVLIGAILYCIYLLYSGWHQKVITLTTIVLSVLLVVFVPKIWFLCIGGNLMEQNIYMSGLPRFYEGEFYLWIPYILVGVFFLIMSIFLVKGIKVSSKSRLTSLILSVGLLACLVIFRYQDANFSETLKALDAIDNQQWDKAAAIGLSREYEPTRLNVMLTSIALQHLNQGGNKMFVQRHGSANYNTTRDGRALHDVGASTISYHLGRINYAYRWGMEYKVEMGSKIQYLKQMAKCALLNGEYPLAKKYLSTLQQTLFHKSWAEKYLAYAENPALMEDDEEFCAIRPLMGFDNTLDLDHGSFEGYLLPIFYQMRNGTPQMLEISLQSALLAQKLEAFISKIRAYSQTNSQMPVHYQEAILLWSYVKDVDPRSFGNIDPMIENRFNQFLNVFQQTDRLPQDQQAEMMKSSFGDTYWYYYNFCNDLKII